MIGKTFGKLKVVSLYGTNHLRQRVWLCLCDCGSETLVATNSLNTGNTKSCGCLSRERSSETHFVHGMSDSRLYRIHRGMIQRCCNPNDHSFKYYGLKGVTVCDEWRYDFAAFYNWAIFNGYRDDLTIDRYPNNRGNYEPSNCRWATHDEQSQNRSSTILTSDQVRSIKLDNREYTEIATDYGVNKYTIRDIKVGRNWKNITA